MEKLVVFIILGVIAHSARCLESESIVGGVETDASEIKYQVSVRRLGLHICGGSIIDEEFVLSAAHCFINQTNQFDSEQKTVVVGIQNLNDTGIELNVTKVYVPRMFNGSEEFPVGDIAVLQLERKFNLSSNLNLTKLKLPPVTRHNSNGLDHDLSYEDTVATITGFGINNILIKFTMSNGYFGLQEDGELSNTLLKAKAEVVNFNKCSSFYRNRIFETLHLCAKVIEQPPNVKQGICSGDSGGPLVENNTIIGLVSRSFFGCDERTSPTIYTRVSAFVQFIERVKSKNTKKIRQAHW